MKALRRGRRGRTARKDSSQPRLGAARTTFPKSISLTRSSGSLPGATKRQPPASTAWGHPPLPSPAKCRAASPKMEPISRPGITSWRRPCCRACRPDPHGEVGLVYALAANLPPSPNHTLDPRPSRTDLALPLEEKAAPRSSNLQAGGRTHSWKLMYPAQGRFPLQGFYDSRLFKPGLVLPLEEKAAPRSSNLQAGGRTHSWKLMYPAQGRFPLQGFYDFRTLLPVNLDKSMQERAHTLQPRNASVIGR